MVGGMSNGEKEFEYQCECNLSYVKESEKVVVEIGQGHLKDLHRNVIAERDALQAEVDKCHELHNQHVAVIDRWANISAAQYQEIEELKVEVDKLLNVMQWAVDNVTIELNPSNYDHDDACQLNSEVCEALIYLQKIIDIHSVTKGGDK